MGQSPNLVTTSRYGAANQRAYRRGGNEGFKVFSAAVSQNPAKAARADEYGDQNFAFLIAKSELFVYRFGLDAAREIDIRGMGVRCVIEARASSARSSCVPI